jgi:hypothetical protein
MQIMKTINLICGSSDSYHIHSMIKSGTSSRRRRMMIAQTSFRRLILMPIISPVVIYRANADGSRTITELRFGGKRQVIVFGR